MGRQPIVSVILPVRNAARTIDDALNSVLAQTFRTFEVIVVDDGSTDGSADCIREASKQDARVRVVPSRSRGLTVALNTGIALAAGRFIARQDADDISMPDRFARQVDRLEQRSQLCAVGTGAIVIDEAGHSVGRLQVGSGPATVRGGLRNARMTPVHGSMMIRRECLRAVGGYREAFVACQDFDLWLRLAERYEIDNVTDPLYHWRLTSNSMYGSRRRTQLLYCGIALAFAKERVRFGTDSYALLEQTVGDLESFATGYRLRGLLEALWGDLILRGINDSRLASSYLGSALRNGYLNPRTFLLWLWTSVGLPWIGSKPLRAQEHAPGPDRAQ